MWDDVAGRGVQPEMIPFDPAVIGLALQARTMPVSRASSAYAYSSLDGNDARRLALPTH